MFFLPLPIYMWSHQEGGTLLLHGLPARGADASHACRVLPGQCRLFWAVLAVVLVLAVLVVLAMLAVCLMLLLLFAFLRLQPEGRGFGLAQLRSQQEARLP